MPAAGEAVCKTGWGMGVCDEMSTGAVHEEPRGSVQADPVWEMSAGAADTPAVGSWTAVGS